MTVEIEMTDEEFKTVSEYAAEKNFSLSKAFLNALFEKISSEKISDKELLKVSNEIINKRAEVYEALAK